jgi:FkbM family methyltransferase
MEGETCRHPSVVHMKSDSQDHRLTGSQATWFAARSYLHPAPGWVLGGAQNATLIMRLRKIVWRQLRKPFAVPWLDGLQIHLYPGNETSRSIFVTGLYDPNELSLLARVLKPGMTFLDAGANMGLYTIFAAQKVGTSGRVLAIEPSQRELAILRGNLELNSLINVTVAPVALSDRPAELELLVAPMEKSGHNTLGAFGFDTPLDHRERVRAVRLDDLVAEHRLARVDVVKMDIEGGEEAALRGAAETISAYHPVLFLELSHRSLQHQNSSAARLLELLGEYGYRVHGYEASTGLPSPEPRPCSEENVIAVFGDSRPW